MCKRYDKHMRYEMAYNQKNFEGFNIWKRKVECLERQIFQK